MPIAASSQVSEPLWTSADDLFMVYGETSVRKWADLDNNGNREYQDRRIQWAIRLATVDAKARLYGSPAGDIADPPMNLQHAVAQLAGYRLYNSRGVRDSGDDKEGRHRLSQNKREADSFFRMVHAGQIVLSGTTGTITYPVIIAPTVQHPNGKMLTPEEMMNQNDADEKDMTATLFDQSQFNETA